MPSSSRYGVSRSPGTIASVSTKFGITCTGSWLASAAHFTARRCRAGRRQDGDRVGDAVAPAARAAVSAPMTQRLVIAPVSIAASGKTSWMLNTKRRTAQHGDEPSDQAERERRRHHEHGVDPAEPAPGAQRLDAGEQRVRRGTRRPAEQVGLVVTGERMDRVIEPHGVRSTRHQATRPAGLDAMSAVPGQRGDDVDLVPQRRRARRRCGSSRCRSVRCRARSADRARRSACPTCVVPFADRHERMTSRREAVRRAASPCTGRPR